LVALKNLTVPMVIERFLSSGSTMATCHAVRIGRTFS